MTYYALSDNQNDGMLMHTGRNATSKEDVKAALLSYAEPDIDKSERELLEGLSPDELADCWDFSITSSETKFDEEE